MLKSYHACSVAAEPSTFNAPVMQACITHIRVDTVTSIAAVWFLSSKSYVGRRALLSWSLAFFPTNIVAQVVCKSGPVLRISAQNSDQ